MLETRQTRRAIRAGLPALLALLTITTPASAGPPTATPKRCWGRISAVGCCIGEQLMYCDTNGKLSRLDCGGTPRCGWRATGRYDCNTAGAADPAGRHPRFCSLPDAGLPFDLGAGTKAADGGCGKVTEEGCCYGQELRFCQEGTLRRISCERNRFCGWRGVAQAYNCGTDGKADPRKKHPRECPGGSPDAGPQRFPDRGLATTAPASLPAAAKGGCGGCGCEIGGGAADASAQLLLLLWLALAISRCSAGERKSRSQRRRQPPPPA
ncbi:MAG: hypothetical protein CSA65_07930 [Proteobacteria bacterium]|nr:MAG: hypothetical protein CSA65_07930 [Pseudomonadota bacterium]